MLFDEFLFIQKLLVSILVGYLLGSVPFAHLAARYKGVDIFNTGSRRAGTANVFWNVSRRTGAAVLTADVAKGYLSVIIAGLLNIQGPLVLLAGAAAVVGHWNSVFTGFRGGDGMATLIGVTLTLAPALALLGIVVGLITVLLFWRSPLRSAWGIASCFAAVLGLSLYFQVQQLGLVLGLVILATLVLSHNRFVNRHLAEGPSPDEMGLNIDLNSDEETNSDLGPTASENC
jgi:acyl-phosphate glycerol 3-phosphate acyltransferase